MFSCCMCSEPEATIDIVEPMAALSGPANAESIDSRGQHVMTLEEPPTLIGEARRAAEEMPAKMAEAGMPTPRRAADAGLELDGKPPLSQAGEAEPEKRASESAPLPAAPLPGFEVIFRTIAGEELPIVFRKTPFGFRFRNKMPIIVTTVDPGSQADGLGVQVGMELTTLGGRPVGPSYRDVIREIRAAGDALSKVKGEP
mmetsp:Transcript_108122/g.312421  ORF Transcript_108122/g.312421 Transcript_108122/m.312421 type:complete len:200 (-) Transcript_108122:225-824(-)